MVCTRNIFKVILSVDPQRFSTKDLISSAYKSFQFFKNRSKTAGGKWFKIKIKRVGATLGN